MPLKSYLSEDVVSCSEDLRICKMWYACLKIYLSEDVVSLSDLLISKTRYACLKIYISKDIVCLFEDLPIWSTYIEDIVCLFEDLQDLHIQRHSMPV